MGRKRPKPGTWRCSNCNLNYPDTTELSHCVVCDTELNHFNNDFPHADLIDRIKMAVAHTPERKLDFGGPTALLRFAKEISSLNGADDFIFECEKKGRSV